MKDTTVPSHRYHTFVLLMLSGGFMGAYSYFLKGRVFANAETANLLILALSIAERNIDGAVSVLIPIAAFAIGSFFSQMFIEKLKGRWIPILLCTEIVLLLFLSFLPDDTPFSVFHVVIAVISSMQFNSFREARGVAMSTLFCTAHLRGFSSSLYTALSKKDKSIFKRSMYHLGLIATFVAGGILCALIGDVMGSRTIILSCIPLLFVLQEVLRKEVVF